MAWRMWTQRLERSLRGEVERRRARDDVHRQAARTIGAMVLRTVGTDAGPFEGLTPTEAAEAFQGLPPISEGFERLRVIAARKKGGVA